MVGVERQVICYNLAIYKPGERVVMRLEEMQGYLTPHEAGEVVGVSKQTMVKYLEDRFIRGVKTHQGWLVCPEDAERVARERAHKQATKGG